MHKGLLTALALTLVAGGFFVPPTSARAEEVPYFSPSHIWADNTVNRLPGFAVTFYGFTSLAGLAVTHGTAPAFLPVNPLIRVVTHCLPPSPLGESVWACDTKGEAGAVVAAGEYSTSISINEEVDGGSVLRYTGTLPITVCDGPCSDLFSLSVAPSPLRYMVGTPLADQAQGSLVFNLDWNATEIAFSELLDDSGNPAPGVYDMITEPPVNGAHFGFRGSFSEVGEYSLEVAVTDEFGVVHTDTVPVTICGDENCMAGSPALANTGLEQNTSIGWGLLLLLVGLVLRRIWSSRASVR
jgi:hypothetical protein